MSETEIVVEVEELVEGVVLLLGIEEAVAAVESVTEGSPDV